MPETVLLGAKFADDFKHVLSQSYRLLDLADNPHLTAQDLAQVRAVVTLGHARTDRAFMDTLPQLGLICCYGSGYDAVDTAAAAERGIVVAYSPGANAASVADLGMGLVIAGVRQVLAADRFLREGRWTTQKMPPVKGLSERRLGIYGLGNIGGKIAARAAAFDMEVAYHGRRRREDISLDYHADLSSLASWADVLVICVRADAANRHSVDAKVLQALGSEGYLVNVARGSVVDQPALIQALEDGVIAGAALDVFDGEPEVPRRLIEMEQVILTPHIGAGSFSAHKARQALVLENLTNFFAGRPLPDRV